MDESLHIKYRPKTLDEVVGQDHVVKSLKALFKKNVPHAFLFTGNAGCGKTTLARIVAAKLGCVDAQNGLLEIDAAKNTGVDDMRTVADGLIYQSLGRNKRKFIIIDEAHMLSKSAWNSLLKIVEEPPEHVYWAFCTTEPSKVIKTVRTRTHAYELRDVRGSVLTDLVKSVAKEEKIKLDKKAYNLIAKESDGSPRQALVYLSMAANCESLEEVTALLGSATESGEIIDLCRLLVSGKAKWANIQPLLNKLTDKNNESIRLVVVNYTSKVLLGTSDSRKAQNLLAILDAFSEPCNPSEKMSPIMLACGELLFE